MPSPQELEQTLHSTQGPHPPSTVDKTGLISLITCLQKSSSSLFSSRDFPKNVNNKLSIVERLTLLGSVSKWYWRILVIENTIWLTQKQYLSPGARFSKLLVTFRTRNHFQKQNLNADSSPWSVHFVSLTHNLLRFYPFNYRKLKPVETLVFWSS